MTDSFHRDPDALPAQGDLAAVIFDVDGVLVASPHEQAWREALEELLATDWRDLRTTVPLAARRFTTDFYQEHVAGKPRFSGAQAALAALGLPDDAGQVETYAAHKQRRLEALIDAGDFVAYGDALRFALAAKAGGLRLAVASSSKNANRFLARIRLDHVPDGQSGQDLGSSSGTLLDLFDANVCGRDLPQGKPHPAIFLAAAAELGTDARRCVVIEDAASGIQAARAAEMDAIGVARFHDEALLEQAGADLVVTTLDEVSVRGLLGGRVERARSAAPGHAGGTR